MISLLPPERSEARYAEEILRHAGLATKWAQVGDLTPSDILLLPGEVDLVADEREWIASLVPQGLVVVTCGGTNGLDDIAGATDGPEASGWLTAFDADHPVTAGLPPHLHVFSGRALVATGGTSLSSLASTPGGDALGAGVVVHRIGAGAVVTIGPEIAADVLHIQLGREIHEDGEPAPDCSAPIDDKILKTDDGVVLDWIHDRVQTPPEEGVPDCPGIDPAFPAGDTPWFGIPIADELRALLLQAIAWAASESGIPLASLEPWPGEIPAVGLISHDSDGNLDAGAQTTLRLLDEAGIRSTWCHIWGPNYPNQYEPGTFEAITAAGHEIALHYNSLNQDGGTWGKDHFTAQAAYVRDEAGIDRFTSNKNHYLRWEGLVEFFHWLVDEGIEADQCKGPSKKGNVGYPHGSGLPWFPLDPATGECIDVVEIPLQFQDLWLTCPTYHSRSTIAAALRHRGVAHFLFHQVHLHTRPEVAQAMLDVVAHGRDVGLAWWTSAEINDWERLRREVELTSGGRRVSIRAERPVPEATIAISGNISVSREGVPLPTRTGTRWNQPVTLITLDLPAGETQLTVAKR